MDIRKFNQIVKGYTKRRERRINDELLVYHIAAGKIAQAIWGSRDYKKPIKEIKIAEEESTEYTRKMKVLRTLKRKGLI